MENISDFADDYAVPRRFVKYHNVEPPKKKVRHSAEIYSGLSKRLLATLAEGPATVYDLERAGYNRREADNRLIALKKCGHVAWTKDAGWSERGIKMRRWCLPNHPDATKKEPEWTAEGFVSAGPARKILDHIRKTGRILRQELCDDLKLTYRQVRYYTGRMEEFGIITAKKVGSNVIYQIK